MEKKVMTYVFLVRYLSMTNSYRQMAVVLRYPLFYDAVYSFYYILLTMAILSKSGLHFMYI